MKQMIKIFLAALIVTNAFGFTHHQKWTGMPGTEIKVTYAYYGKTVMDAKGKGKTHYATFLYFYTADEGKTSYVSTVRHGKFGEVKKMDKSMEYPELTFKKSMPIHFYLGRDNKNKENNYLVDHKSEIVGQKGWTVYYYDRKTENTTARTEEQRTLGAYIYASTSWEDEVNKKKIKFKEDRWFKVN